MAVPPGVLPPDVANDLEVVTQKAGLTPWHARLLKALERIADYYAELPPLKGSRRSDA